jgi:phospholipid/cholesterol/gamma-HCH transport system substrate-binding protein
MRRLTCGLAAAVALLGSGVLSGCEATDLPLPGSPVDKDESISVTVEFDDVLNLVPRSPVKVNDVTVGEVVDLKRVGWHAEALLRIQDDVDLPADVSADIRQTSLLGEKYVALVPAEGASAGGGRLEDGTTIPLAATGRNPELEEVLGALSFLLNGGGVGQLSTITREINAVFEGRQGRMRHLLRELRTLVSGLDDQKQDIIQAMEALNGFSGTLNREKKTVTAALDEFPGAVEVLADQRQQLMAMLRALDRLGVVGTRVIGATKDDLLEDLRSLEPIVREIADADDKIPPALGLLISFPFPIESNNIVYGDYANTSIVFSINLDNLFQNQPSGPGGGGGGGGTCVPGTPLCLPGGGGGELPLPEIPGLPGLDGRGGSGSGGSGSGDGGLLGGLLGTSRTSSTSLDQLLGGGGAA